MILLPIAAFLAFVAAARAMGTGWREAFVRASIGWGLAVVLVTESLSLLRGLEPARLALAWAAVAGLGVLVLVRVRDRSARSRWIELPVAGVRGVGLLPLGTVLLGTLALALVSAPNSWDALVYHLSRVEHWRHNASVAHYPTHVERQLFLAPWMEFALLQFQTLGNGSDRLANGVQWFAFLGCMASVSLLVARLGGNLAQQHLAALFVATTPVLLLHATSSKNDLACAYWISCVALYALELLRETRWSSVGFLGAALGLALLTKATAYPIAAPFVLAAVVAVLMRRGSAGKLAPIAVLLALALLPSAGHWLRNQEVYASPLGPPSLHRIYRNEWHGLRPLVSNLVRNTVVQFSTPWRAPNAWLERRTAEVHRLLGVDPSDPRTTALDGVFWIARYWNDESYASNFLPALLILVAAAHLSSLRRLEGRTRLELAVFCVCGAAGFVLFCLLLKWEPWIKRLHVPFYVLAAVPVGFLLGRRARVAGLLAGLLLLGALPVLFLNRLRPVLSVPSMSLRSAITTPRVEQYFVAHPARYTSYRDTILDLLGDYPGCLRLGLRTGDDSWEYAIWRLAWQQRPGLDLVHVEVDNASKGCPQPGGSAPVCTVLYSRPVPDELRRPGPLD